LLAQRLDTLGSAKIGAQLAAVIGYEFGERFYFELAEKAGVSNPEEKLTRCIGSGVVRRSGRPGHNRYTFRHGLLRDAAYASVIGRDRRQHHRIIADLMIREGMGRTDPSAVAYHLIKSGQEAAAVPFMHHSAKRHMAESANREALSDLDQALELVPELPQEERAEVELALQLDYGAILVALKGYGAPEMVRTYERACELCKTVGEPSSLLSAHWGAWAFYIVRGDFRTALDLSLEIERIAAHTSSSAVVVESHHVLGVTHFNFGRFGDAVKQFDAGLKLFGADHGDEAALSQGQDSKIALLCWKALSLTYLGDFSSALSSLRAAVDRAGNIKHRLSEVFARTFSAIVIDAQHEFDAARRKAAAASRLAEEETFGYWQAWNDFLWGASESSLKVSKTSLARTHSAIRAYAKTGAKVWLPYMVFRFAGDLSRMGRDTEAETVLNRGKQLLDGEADRYYFADICCFEAEISLNLGREKSAIALLENGWRIAMQQSNLLVASHILNAAKRLKSSQGMKQRKAWQEEISSGREIPSSISDLL
jgi:tetratricopeptide (TPR) repeat protein